MSYASDASGSQNGSGLERLDDLPKGAWIAIMVVAFVLAWPIGLLVLGYLLWSGKMQSWRSDYRCSKRSRRRHGRRSRPTGNSAFDGYRSETLKRLEEEQEAFEAFLAQLRQAKDQKEFDEFMAMRTRGDEGSGPSPTSV